MSLSVTRRIVAGLGVGAFALTCVLSCASIPPTNYYVLGLPRESARSGGESRFPHAVSIEPFESEPTYVRKKIIWRSESNRMGYYSYERWAALPAEMFAFRMYERARGSGLFRSVRPEGSRSEADLFIGGKILAFEEFDTADGSYGRVEVALELTDGDGETIWSGVKSHTEPTTGPGVEAVVEAIAVATEMVITEALSSIESSIE